MSHGVDIVSEHGSASERPSHTVDEDVVLSVSGLRTEFVTHSSRVAAVRGVDLTVRRGEKIGIVGESGSGKSALALSILGLIEPPGHVSGGRVVIGGRDVSRFDDREMRRVRGKDISIVFQDPMTSLNPVKRIGDQLAEAVRVHQPKLGRQAVRQRAIELLRDVEIPRAEARLDDYPGQYSGGMRQRVLIAIALANNPSVLIADEPTTALDVTTQAQILWLLDKMVAKHGTAVILITHNLGVVAEFCSMVHVMYAGRFVESAPTPALFNTPVHPYTEALLRSVLRPDRLSEGPLPTIPGAPPDLTSLGPGCPFEPRCPVGHEQAMCREQRPPVVTVSKDGIPASTAECHFAPERATRFGLTTAIEQ